MENTQTAHQGDGVPPRQRRPVFGVLAVASPLAGAAVCALMFLLMDTHANEGMAGMAVLGLGIFSIFVGLALGAVATVLALLRRERWWALQWIGAAIALGVGLPVLQRFTGH